LLYVGESRKVKICYWVISFYPVKTLFYGAKILFTFTCFGWLVVCLLARQHKKVAKKSKRFYPVKTFNQVKSFYPVKWFLPGKTYYPVKTFGNFTFAT